MCSYYNNSFTSWTKCSLKLSVLLIHQCRILVKLLTFFFTRSVRTQFFSQKWHNWLISNKYKNYTSFDQSANVDFDLLITWVLHVKSREVARKVVSVLRNYSETYSRRCQTFMVVFFDKIRYFMPLISLTKILHHRCLTRS